MAEVPEPASPDPARHGIGLLTIVALILVVMTSASTVALVVARDAFEDDLDELRSGLAASYACEAGLAAGICDLREGGEGQIGSSDRPVPLGQGAYWVRTTRLSSGMLSMVSTGRSNEAQRRTELIARQADEDRRELETVSIRNWFELEDE